MKNLIPKLAPKPGILFENGSWGSIFEDILILEGYFACSRN